MASTFSSQQTTHALFLLLPLNLPLLLIPNASVTKHNNACDYFKQGECLKKGMPQNNVLDVFQDAGLHEFNYNMLYKDNSMLSKCGMSNVIFESRLLQASFFTTQSRCMHANFNRTSTEKETLPSLLCLYNGILNVNNIQPCVNATKLSTNTTCD